MKIIAFCNQKGGAGKTTITLNTAGALVEREKRVLLIDLDPQASLSSVFIPNLERHAPTIATLFRNSLSEKISVEQVIVKNTHVPRIDLLPSNGESRELEKLLMIDDEAQYYLKEELGPIREQYDYILIDCPPNLYKFTKMALVAADGCVIPLVCQEWCVSATVDMISFINTQVKVRPNRNLIFMGFVINQYASREKVERAYHDQVMEQHPEAMFKTEIRYLTQYKQAAMARLPITHFLPESEAAQLFRDFANELVTYEQSRQIS